MGAVVTRVSCELLYFVNTDWLPSSLPIITVFDFINEKAKQYVPLDRLCRAYCPMHECNSYFPQNVLFRFACQSEVVSQKKSRIVCGDACVRGIIHFVMMYKCLDTCCSYISSRVKEENTLVRIHSIYDLFF